MQALLVALTLVRTLALEGDTFHVQGIALDGPSLWVTSVDQPSRKGWLFEYSLESGKRLRAVELQQGAMYHPGGFDVDGDSLWIPVAEYRKESRSIIQRRLKQTLELLSSFEVADHIGCLTSAGGRLVGGNWDARKFYEWTPDGRQLRVRSNPLSVRYQDIKYRDGALIASGLGPAPASPSLIHWLDPEDLAPLQSAAPGRTDRKVEYSREGMDLRDGLLYLLPEDTPSRLFVFRL
ncbi:MAG: hypothetical protein HY858_03215 [Candidatus Solibacter usitatus]|nr:hypothetical protein [Candidatus Solibacter usitatus]